MTCPSNIDENEMDELTTKLEEIDDEIEGKREEIERLEVKRAELWEKFSEYNRRGDDEYEAAKDSEIREGDK